MPRTRSSSSSPRADLSRLVQLSLGRLLPHPANPNRMDEQRLEKLRANISLEDDYPLGTTSPPPSVVVGVYHSAWTDRVVPLTETDYPTRPAMSISPPVYYC